MSLATLSTSTVARLPAATPWARWQAIQTALDHLEVAHGAERDRPVRVKLARAIDAGLEAAGALLTAYPAELVGAVDADDDTAVNED